METLKAAPVGETSVSGGLEMTAYLFEGVVEFTQDIVLVKDFALVTVLVVVVDFLPHVCWKLMEGHVLLHLFVLQEEVDSRQLISALMRTESSTKRLPRTASTSSWFRLCVEGGRWCKDAGTSTGLGPCQAKVTALVISRMQDAHVHWTTVL